MFWRKKKDTRTILHRIIPHAGFMDKECFDNIETDRNLMVPWFLMSCFAISENAPILSPEMHRRLSARLYREFDVITHPNLGLLDYEDVRNEVDTKCNPSKFRKTKHYKLRSSRH